jgi:hypothetical protein
MKFNKKNKNYLGNTKDSTNASVDGFLQDDIIYLVYHLGSEDQYSVNEPLNKVLAYEDEYMWTPYAVFSYKADLLSKTLV